ncbi:MAG: hypothetical protein KY461_14850 [Actinobacteria bacterium]|nr:hypothetical protein [Actinomycetota bacterium]
MSRPQQLDPDRPRHRIVRRPDADPDPERLVAAVARAVLEVEVGRRPLSQLEPVLSPAVVGRLAVRDDRIRRTAKTLRSPLVGPDATTVVRVLGQRPSEDAFEAVVLVRRFGRVLAVAMRAERYRGSWRIVELARPEDAPAPAEGPVDVPPEPASGVRRRGTS